MKFCITLNSQTSYHIYVLNELDINFVAELDNISNSSLDTVS